MINTLVRGGGGGGGSGIEQIGASDIKNILIPPLKSQTKPITVKFAPVSPRVYRHLCHALRVSGPSKSENFA